MVSRKLAAAIHFGLAALLFVSIPLSSQASDAQLAARSREIAARKFVTLRLQIWQERLNLKEWNIRVQLVRAGQLEPQTLGNVNWDTDEKSARISVLSSYDYKLPYREMLDDMEFTVVHELVHIQLASLPRSEASRRVEEHAVNELAAALLRLARH
jgi:hypothetical protein